MEEKLIDILWLVKEGKLHPNRGYKQILSLLGENEVVVLDAPDAKHVALLDVRECNASGDTTNAIEHTSGAALEKITSDGILCPYCGSDDQFWWFKYEMYKCHDCLADWTKKKSE